MAMAARSDQREAHRRLAAARCRHRGRPQLRGGYMDIDAARQFLREHHRAVLATRRADGRLQLSPVLVGLDAEGHVIISTRETALKTRNMRRDPQVSLCVMNDAFFG